MADDRNNRGPQDRSRVNIDEDYELRYRSEKWGVTLDQVPDQVKASADAVARQLGKQA